MFFSGAEGGALRIAAQLIISEGGGKEEGRERGVGVGEAKSWEIAVT